MLLALGVGTNAEGRMKNEEIKQPRGFFSFVIRHSSFVIFLLLLRRTALANPTGMAVQSGSASAAVNGSTLTITAGNNAVLNWQSFNIGAGESTIFNQPSAASIVWNRINDQNPSQIYGNLQANGIVVLMNSSGFYFGPNAFVGAAGLVVSTANCLPPQNAAGAWTFNGPPPLASIVNYGQLRVGQRRLVLSHRRPRGKPRQHSSARRQCRAGRRPDGRIERSPGRTRLEREGHAAAGFGG